MLVHSFEFFLFLPIIERPKIAGGYKIGLSLCLTRGLSPRCILQKLRVDVFGR